MSQPLSYYLHCPKLENILGSEFGKIKDHRYAMKELLTYVAQSIYTNGGIMHRIKYCPQPAHVQVAVDEMSEPDKIALVRAISAHL